MTYGLNALQAKGLKNTFRLYLASLLTLAPLGALLVIAYSELAFWLIPFVVAVLVVIQLCVRESDGKRMILNSRHILIFARLAILMIAGASILSLFNFTPHRYRFQRTANSPPSVLPSLLPDSQWIIVLDNTVPFSEASSYLDNAQSSLLKEKVSSLRILTASNRTLLTAQFNGTKKDREAQLIQAIRDAKARYRDIQVGQAYSHEFSGVYSAISEGLELLRTNEESQSIKHLYILTKLEVFCAQNIFDNKGIKVTISVTTTPMTADSCFSKSSPIVREMWRRSETEREMRRQSESEREMWRRSEGEMWRRSEREMWRRSEREIRNPFSEPSLVEIQLAPNFDYP